MDLSRGSLQDLGFGEFVILEGRLERFDVDPREEVRGGYAAHLHLDGLVEGVDGGVHHRGEGGARFDRRAVVQRGDELLVLRVDTIHEDLAEVGDRRLVPRVHPRCRIARHHELQLHGFATQVLAHIAGTVHHSRNQVTGVGQVARLLIGHVHRGGGEKEPARVRHGHGDVEVHQEFVAVRVHNSVVQPTSHHSAFESRHLERVRTLYLIHNRTQGIGGSTAPSRPSQRILVNVRSVVPTLAEVLFAREYPRSRTICQFAGFLNNLTQSVPPLPAVAVLIEIQELVVEGEPAGLTTVADRFEQKETLPFAHDVAVLRELQVLNVYAAVRGGGRRVHQRDLQVPLLEPLGRGAARVVGVGGREIAGHQIVHRRTVVSGARVRGQADVHQTGVLALHDGGAPEVGEVPGVRVAVAEGVTRRVHADAQLHTPCALHTRVGNASTQAEPERRGDGGNVGHGAVRVLGAELEGVLVSDVHAD